jgi:hypothetical protein
MKAGQDAGFTPDVLAALGVVQKLGMQQLDGYGPGRVKLYILGVKNLPVGAFTQGTAQTIAPGNQARTFGGRLRSFLRHLKPSLNVKRGK